VDASKLFNEEDVTDVLEVEPKFETRFVVNNHTTLKALYALSSDEKERACVLNFASAKNPGGGFKKGSTAQEETLARSSSLYNSLIKFEKPFYKYNKSHPGVYSHRIIFSPKITFFKSDSGKGVAETVVSVITAPAVNAGVAKVSKQQVALLMEERMRRILEISKREKKEVLILGAFGCGVFKNEPAFVAQTFRKLLDTQYRGVFDLVVFACYGPKENLHAFEKQFLEAK
jgi:uncharacterized protein (TIGR02452 family)